MKANELRIGNYLNYKNTETGLYKNALPIEDGTEIDICIYGKLEAEPIPLTEEWLEKFGFEKYYYFGYIKNFLCINTIREVVNFEIMGQLTPIKGFKFPKHVHQLQNLYFALTGEELTIKE